MIFRKHIGLVLFMLAALSACDYGRGDSASTIADNYVYVDNGTLSRYIEKDGKKIISDIVVSHRKDDKYIYAVRQVKKNYYCDSDDNKNKYVGFEVIDKFEYWVIRLEDGYIYGPFDQGEFDEFYASLHLDEMPSIPTIEDIVKNKYSVRFRELIDCKNKSEISN